MRNPEKAAPRPQSLYARPDQNYWLEIDKFTEKSLVLKWPIPPSLQQKRKGQLYYFLNINPYWVLEYKWDEDKALLSGELINQLIEEKRGYLKTQRAKTKDDLLKREFQNFMRRPMMQEALQAYRKRKEDLRAKNEIAKTKRLLATELAPLEKKWQPPANINEMIEKARKDLNVPRTKPKDPPAHLRDVSKLKKEALAKLKSSSLWTEK